MKNRLLSVLLVARIGWPPRLITTASSSADDTTTDQDRIKTAGQVLKEIMNIPDNIPKSLFDKADLPFAPSVLKAAFIVGARNGCGVIKSCRSGATLHGPWSAPSMMALEGASFGPQAGGQATDFVILVMNDSGADHQFPPAK